MRRLAVFLGLCLLCGPGTLTLARAQQISIAGDMLLDISLRDADLGEVLTALFNTTGGKYQMLIGNGVVGRIARLQLSQTPFEKALDAILGTEYSYTKQQLREGTFLYKITGRPGSGTMPLTTRGGGITQAATIGMPPLDTDTSTAGRSGGSLGSGFGGLAGTRSTTSTGMGSAASTGMGSASSGAGVFDTFSIGPPSSDAISTSSTSAASESFVVRLLRVNNADVGMLSEALGGTFIDLTQLTQPTTESQGSASRGGSNRSSNASRNTNTTNRNTNTSNRNTTNRNTNTTNRNTTNRNTTNRNTSRNR